MTDPTTVPALLRDAEHYLSALHGSVSRHDNLGANLACAGCSLRDRIAAVLPAVLAAAEQSAAVPLPPADQTVLRDRIAEVLYGFTPVPEIPWEEAPGSVRVRFQRRAAAVLAVLPATTDQTDDEADVDTVANRAAQVISSMGAEIRELRGQRDRNHTAWHSARRRASVLSAELTCRAPLLGQYAAELTRLRADRAAVLREAADAVFALEYDVMVGEEGDENMGSMREAWDVGTIHATQLLRCMADETAGTETARLLDCGRCYEEIHPHPECTANRLAELDAEHERWVRVHDLIERAIAKGVSVIDTCQVEDALGPDDAGARQDGVQS